MFTKSTINKNIKIHNTNTTVQTAASGTTISPLGRADVGTTYKNSLVFEDHDLDQNLISIPKLDEEGCEIIIKNGIMTVTRNNIKIMEGKKEKGLYQIDLEGTEMALLSDVKTRDRETTLRRIHNITGHRNLLRINKYVKQKTLKFTGFPKDVQNKEIEAMPLCDGCTRAKFTKRRIKRFTEQHISIGSKILTDMKGPIRVKGVNGERMYQGFMCAHTKFLMHRTFAKKSSAPTNLEEIINSDLFKDKITRYHSDGAPELISKEIHKVLRPTGAVITFSAPYTSNDNAAIERSHRTIFECAHAMLIAACLPILFWTYAVSHAVYLYNIIPTNTGRGYMSPMKAAYDTEVDIGLERTFGCNCYMIIPAQTREKGFTDKSTPGIYLGHRENGAPGYVIYCKETKQVKPCSNVTFDESDLDNGSRDSSNVPNFSAINEAVVSRELDDFKWLEGICYLDENFMYITTRVTEQQKYIVAYRSAVIDGVVGVEESRPVHVAEVVLLVKDFIGANCPVVETEEGLTRVNGEYNAVPPTGADGNNDQLGPGVLPVSDAPIEVVRVSRTAPSSQDTPPGSSIVGGDPQGPSELLGRTRHRRIPLNVGTLGDVERSFIIHSHDTEYIYNVSNEQLSNNNSLLYEDVIISDDKENWYQAAREELQSIVVDNETWTPVTNVPAGARVLTTKWLFKRKLKRGVPDRYKGRLCVRGFEQTEGVNYFETFAPTASWVTLRFFLTLCACMSLTTRQLDVKTAFLYAALDEEIYIQIPKGVRGNIFGLSEDCMKLCRGGALRLKKSLYGLKQAPRNWFETLSTFLSDQGFRALKLATCMFIKYINGCIMIVLVYVDDILIAGANDSDVATLVLAFKDRFKISDSGEVDVYLSIHVERNIARREIYLDQCDYIEQIWKTFKGVENTSVTTPLQQNWRIVIDEELAQASDKDREFVHAFPYRELIGSLLFIMICTRGDVCYAVGYLARFNSGPCKLACLAAKRVLQYLYNTRHKKLVLGGTSTPLLSLFCDTDFAACPDTRLSVECHMIYFGNGCICWKSGKQTKVAQSTAEAEFLAITPGSNSLVWLRNVLKEMGLGYARASTVYTDNDVARATSNNPVHHSRMKQISLKYFVVRDLIKLGVIAVGRIDTTMNPADMGTKPLGRLEFDRKVDIYFLGLDSLYKLDFYEIERPLLVENDEYD